MQVWLNRTASMSDSLAKIRTTLDARPAYCSGTCKILLEQCMLFYSTATCGARYVTQYHLGDRKLK
jgi:hypothetical protein